MPATFPLLTERERDLAIRLIQRTPLDGKSEVVIRRATRNKKQNALLHAALTDIAEQLIWPKPPANHGTLHDLEWWKRRCTLGWLIEERQHAEVITPLFDEDEEMPFGILIPHTSDLNRDQMASLCEWTFAFGAQQAVAFKEPKDKPASEDDYEAYR